MYVFSASTFTYTCIWVLPETKCRHAQRRERVEVLDPDRRRVREQQAAALKAAAAAAGGGGKKSA